jgi:outer membrane protein OmpA-like peptidoglycan-associated protein/Tol biopolymer transport system component
VKQNSFSIVWVAALALGLVGAAGFGLVNAQSAAITGLTQLTNDKDVDLYPAVSPDGKQVAFESIKKTISGGGSNVEIMVVDDKGQVARMTTDKADDANPAWMNDQKGLLFDSLRFDKRGLWIKSLVAGGETQLSRGKTVDFDAHCNPKQNTIVFTAIEKGKDLKPRSDGERWKKFKGDKMPYIWMVNVDGSGLTQLIKGLNPKWSPDGKTIVFASNIAGDYNIYSVRPDGSGLQQLTSRTDLDVEPTWSPDGESICFVSNVHKGWNLWMMKSDGTRLTQLTTHPKFDGGPSWGRDGFIYFHSNRSGNWDIWKLKPSGYEVSPWFEDKDKDGIKDAADKCPADAEDKDSFQDTDGCPDPDNDNDGLKDETDKCPNEAETVNGYDDEDGCPDENPMPKSQILHGVDFRGSSSDLIPNSYPVLQNLAQVLRKAKGIRVEIRVHTDDRGADSYNRKVSQQRADSVRNYLMGMGVEASQVTATGYGESTPIASNNTASGKAQNRRVEVFRID